MSRPKRAIITVGLIVGGSALLVSPIRRHRAVWHVTVGYQPARRRVVHGGEFAPTVAVMLSAIRSGDRRPDAETRFAVGLGLVASGLVLNAAAASA
jgi:hypothetical protein